MSPIHRLHSTDIEFLDNEFQYKCFFALFFVAFDHVWANHSITGLAVTLRFRIGNDLG
jgi:hypothetical protein